MSNQYAPGLLVSPSFFVVQTGPFFKKVAAIVIYGRCPRAWLTLTLEAPQVD